MTRVYARRTFDPSPMRVHEEKADHRSAERFSSLRRTPAGRGFYNRAMAEAGEAAVARSRRAEARMGVTGSDDFFQQSDRLPVGGAES